MKTFLQNKLRTLMLIGLVSLSIVGNSTVYGQEPSAADKAALISFYNTAGGSGWTNTWNTSDPVSTWYGVTVSGGLVKQINLSDNNLVGPIHDDLYSLTDLTFLHLKDNHLSGSVSPMIGDLVNLNFLGLNNNQLHGVLPTEFGQLASLKELYLQGNAFSGAVPSGFASMHDLQYLFLSANQLDGLPDLSGLNDLIELRVQNNMLDFGDLEPNASAASAVFTHTPQAVAGTPSTVETIQGNPATLYSNVGGTSNTYQWYHDGVLLAGKTSENLFISSTLLADAGLYTCKVKNTVVTGLTIDIAPITLSVLDFTVHTDAATSITFTSAMLMGEVDAGSAVVTKKGFVYGTTPAPTGNEIDKGAGSATFGHTITTLLDQTSYYVRAFADIVGIPDRVYGNEVSFTTPSIEESVLIALYDATDGDNWTNNTNWKQNSDLSTWYGVEVFNGHVVRLDLSNNNLTGMIPDLSLLTELFHIYLNDNNFQFGDLDALWYWLQQLPPNNISYAPQNMFGSGGNLEYMDGEVAELFEDCSGSGNIYEWEEDYGFGFYIAQYQSGTNPDFFFLDKGDTKFRLKVTNANFPLLTLYSAVFHIDVTTDRDILEAFFHYNGGIDWFDNSGWLSDDITNSPWFGITWDNQPVPHVTSIDLSNNNLTGSLYPGLSKLTYLESLYVGGNELTLSDDNGEFLNEFENLEFLGLYHNNIENIPNLEPLFSNPNLFNPFHVSVEGNMLEFDDLQRQPIGRMQYVSYSNQAMINEPYSLTGFAGGTFELTVETPGDDLFYEWFIDPAGINTPLYNGQDYEGVHTSTLTIKNLPAGVTTYTCRVTNNSLPLLTLVRETITIDASAFDINSTVSWYISTESSANSTNNAINVMDFNEAGLASVNVYSGNANTGDFTTKLGTIDLTGSPSGYTFVDATSDPSTRAYAYKLSAVDNSITGTESMQSDYQQSVHLTVNLGLGNARNMLWTPYMSENGLVIVDSYDVMGGSTMDVNSMSLIESLPGNLTSYTDNGNYSYYAIVTNLVGIPTPLKSGGMFLKSNSNVFSTDEILYMPSINDLKIYPNPAVEQATISFENPDNLSYTLRIVDINGRICMTREDITSNQYSFDVAELTPGLYIVQILGDQLLTGRMVIDK